MEVGQETLKVNELYSTIQGESTWAGFPCVIVRLAGCPFRCRWCDTTYAYEEGVEMCLAEIARRVLDARLSLVEVTGGEPLAQSGTPLLLTRLCDLGLNVLLETNGMTDTAGVDERVHVILDVKTPSSGHCGGDVAQNIARLKAERDEVKFVIEDERDFAWAVQKVAEFSLADRARAVLFSPVFGRMNYGLLADWIVKSGLPVRLQLQQHKHIWPGKIRGV